MKRTAIIPAIWVITGASPSLFLVTFVPAIGGPFPWIEILVGLALIGGFWGLCAAAGFLAINEMFKSWHRVASVPLPLCAVAGAFCGFMAAILVLSVNGSAGPGLSFCTAICGAFCGVMSKQFLEPVLVRSNS